jgi:regulator of protease activity HflC (stomatin/prohibitin superfamily)
MPSNGMIASFVMGFIIVIILGMAGCPQYNVYSARMDGEATVARANGAKQALVAQAMAEKESAQLRADAIKIVGQAAKDYPEYRQQEFIGAFAEAMQSGKISQIIYVPTEANIPIIEANRFTENRQLLKEKK